MSGRRNLAGRITCRNCKRPGMIHRAHGWCDGCYSRWHRAGRPDDGPPPPGTVPPVDEVIVASAVRGERPTLTPRERRAAVAILTAKGLAARQVAVRLGCTRRTVERHNAANKKGT